MTDQDFLGIMGFNPSDLAVFQENGEGKDRNQNVYKTNPASKKVKVVSEDGHYRSVIKVLYNPFNIKRSIINQCQYVMQDAQGWLFVNSALGEGDKNCPIFKAWKKLWFSGDEEKKAYARKMFERNESRWVLVQVLEDANQPELQGQFKLMKLPKVIYETMIARMNPSADSKKAPQALMDYLIGPALEMDVTPGPDDPAQPERKQREISYSLCNFGTDATPIIKCDGTPLFSDEELEKIDSYAMAKANLEKAKTEAKKVAAQKEIDALLSDIKALYIKAIEYLKENALDVDKECAYHEWDDATKARVEAYCEAVVNMRDPKNSVVSVDSGNAEATDPFSTAVAESTVANAKPDVPEATTFDPNAEMPF